MPKNKQSWLRRFIYWFFRIGVMKFRKGTGTQCHLNWKSSIRSSMKPSTNTTLTSPMTIGRR